MTSLSETVNIEEDTLTKKSKHSYRRHHCRNVLKSKENFKPKCSKCYKRKLKKHKLRKYEPEDEEVVNVSEFLISSLKLKSPNKRKTEFEIELENLRPKNYLFRMVRKQLNGLSVDTENNHSSSITLCDNDSSQESTSPTSVEKKKTNALKLLMDSRNKSFGSNSPGKEKPVDEAELKESEEKKSSKAKRTLILQKMAESKGSIKKKEMEEHQDKIIRKKMEKRAERLKGMLHREPKEDKTDKNKKDLPKEKTRSPLNNLNAKNGEKFAEKPVKTLQLISLFTETTENNVSSEKHIPKEDEEFLKKLSPSLKKKQSMLSYFKKIEKDIDLVTETDNNIIKVKFKPKSKKKAKKNKLSLNKNDVTNCNEEEITAVVIDDISIEQNVNEDNAVNTVLEQDSKEVRKRKRKIKENTNDKINLDESLTIINTNGNGLRPKRNTKKPMKYSEDIYITSSDEELHIFTPKKKKHLSDGKDSSASSLIIDLDKIKTKKKETLKTEENDKNKKEIKKDKKLVKEQNQQKKPVKLAPIFAIKTPLDPAAIEAKQKFLSSGVPDQLKKIIAKQKENNVLSNSFFKVVHIQQLGSATLNNIDIDLNIENTNNYVTDFIMSENVTYQKLLDLQTSHSNDHIGTHFNTKNNIQFYLQYLKDTYQKFPVYRTYKLMRSKKKGEFKNNINYLDLDNSTEILNGSIDNLIENPDQLNWCDKYKPLDGNQIIGNFDSIRELKKWLINWTENKMKSKTGNSYDSDSSDFCTSDADSRDSLKMNNNLLILSGPIGSGKTSSVYAIAAELSIKVIEVNASSKRTGKIMLQDLQEATQSHKVNRGTGSSENSQKSQELIIPVPKEYKGKKRGRPKKLGLMAPKKVEKLDKINSISSSQESSRTAMSLILIDDADIVFEQDDGFCSAIVQLVHSSKRPVILITGSLACPHLQRFIQGSKILKMNSLLPNMLGTWLDIMCLADTGICSPGIGAKTLDFFKGDIRKTINYLQFYFCSESQAFNAEKESCSQKIEDKINNDEEFSNISWAETEQFENKNVNNNLLDLDNKLWKNHMNVNIDILKCKKPIHLIHIWWGIPKLLNVSEISKNQGIPNNNTNAEDKIKDKDLLDSLTYLLDATSVCDFLSMSSNKLEEDIFCQPWVSYENDSVSENQNVDKYEMNEELNKEIIYEYMKGSIAFAQRRLNCNPEYELDVPSTAVQRKKDRLLSRHASLTNSLNPQSILDRRALGLDYWSSCRTICRIEKSKTDSNNKRNNRFCHYLKSLSIHCKNDSYDSLADSLCPDTSRPSGSL